MRRRFILCAVVLPLLGVLLPADWFVFIFAFACAWLSARFYAWLLYPDTVQIVRGAEAEEWHAEGRP